VLDPRPRTQVPLMLLKDIKDPWVIYPQKGPDHTPTGETNFTKLCSP
jgi:hypothetical protein